MHNENSTYKDTKQTYPLGRVKLVKALRTLLEEKDFSSITTKEIAAQAGVTESLIYKYFVDKRDLLLQFVAGGLETVTSDAYWAIKGTKGAQNKLRRLIWSHVYTYASDQVLAKAICLEVRNHPDFYKSRAYEVTREWCAVIRQTIEEGIANKEIRDDLSSKFILQVVLGSIEHVCLTHIVFHKDIDTDQVCDEICEFVFRGLEPKAE